MDQRQEMMDDAIDDVTGLEDEEEGEEVVNQVLDEIGVDLGQAVRICPKLAAPSLTTFIDGRDTLWFTEDSGGRWTRGRGSWWWR